MIKSSNTSKLNISKFIDKQVTLDFEQCFIVFVILQIQDNLLNSSISEFLSHIKYSISLSLLSMLLNIENLKFF